MDVSLVLNNIGIHSGLKEYHIAKYLFGVKIPFSPGIIPKEKGRVVDNVVDKMKAKEPEYVANDGHLTFI